VKLEAEKSRLEAENKRLAEIQRDEMAKQLYVALARDSVILLLTRVFCREQMRVDTLEQIKLIQAGQKEEAQAFRSSIADMMKAQADAVAKMQESQKDFQTHMATMTKSIADLGNRPIRVESCCLNPLSLAVKVNGTPAGSPIEAAGHFMSILSSNAGEAREHVRLMNLKPGDRVLCCNSDGSVMESEIYYTAYEPKSKDMIRIVCNHPSNGEFSLELTHEHMVHRLAKMEATLPVASAVHRLSKPEKAANVVVGDYVSVLSQDQVCQLSAFVSNCRSTFLFVLFRVTSSTAPLFGPNGLKWLAS